MIDVTCALCGKKQRIRVLYNPTLENKNVSSYIYSARRLPDKLHYRIVKCDKCGLIFSSPIFKPSQIEELYTKSVCSYDEQIPFVTKTYFNLFEKITRLLPANPRVLEVGCGNGFFLKKLKEQGIKKLYGIEPSPEMISKAEKNVGLNIKADIFKKNQFPQGHFDLILCFHTLDHMVDPNEFVQESFKLLRKGGVIITVVHDTGGLSVKLFGERSPIFDIEHIYLFNKKTLREIFARHGFEIVDVFNVVNTYPFSYWIKMSGIPLMSKNILQKTVKTLGLSKIPLSLAGGNICIVGRKT